VGSFFFLVNKIIIDYVSKSWVSDGFYPTSFITTRIYDKVRTIDHVGNKT